MNPEPPSIRPAALILAIWVALFALIIVNGYLLNMLGLAADATLILVATFIEMLLLALGLFRSRLRLAQDSLDVVGFLGVGVGVWLYFLVPSMPTLLPPSYSGDAANHLAYSNAIYQSGQIISDYPGGPALLGATIAHWLGCLPIFVVHPIGALWLALTAASIYAIACAILPDRRVNKLIALFAVFALFVTWNYFAGMLIGSEYFWSQVTAQMFLSAFVFFLIEHRRSQHALWKIGMAFCLIGISVSFQLWIGLPLALFGIVTLRNWRAGNSTRQILTTLIIVLGIPGLFWLMILLLDSRFIPNLSRLSTAGAIALPSFGALGGAFLILPVLGFLMLARTGERGFVIINFTVLAALQSIAFTVANKWLGISAYWMGKTFYLMALPLGLCAVAPIAPVLEFITRRRNLESLTSPVTMLIGCGVLGVGLFGIFPPPTFSPLSESDIQVALWAKQNLPTQHINLIGRKSITAQWLGIGIWGERFPDDLLVDLATLGPKTFEEWRDDPSWGEYLFVPSSQHLPLDPTQSIIYKNDHSMIVAKLPTTLATNILKPSAHFGDALDLIDYDLPRQTFHSGEVISFTARIETQHVPAHQVVWRVQLRDQNQESVTEARIDPFSDKFPLQRWSDGRVLVQPFALSLPVDLRPGLYDLQLGLYYVGNGEPLRYQSADGTTDDGMSLGRIKITLPVVTTHALASVTRTDLRVGDGFGLLGYRLPVKSPIKPGDTLRLDLYWQGLATTTRDFTVFVHLIDSTGVVRAQSDSAPRGGTYPTSIWDAGEIVPDPHSLTLPMNTPPGEYRIEVGMYEWPSLQRLLLTDANQHAQGDHVVLRDRIQVVKP